MDKRKIVDALSSKDGIHGEENANILLKKEEIERHHFKSNDLKRLVIRIDFTGVRKIDNLVFALSKDAFGENFRFVKKISSGNRLSSDENPFAGSRRDLYENSPVYSFFSDDYKATGSKLEIEISEFSISLELKCNHYDGFDGYRDLMRSIYVRLRDLEPYVELKRIGVSKTSAFWAEDQKNIRNAIEIEALPNPVVVVHFPQCSYSDKFYWQERRVSVKLNRQLWWGKMIKEDVDKSVLQVSLNYDVYRDIKELDFGEWQLKDTLDEINNAHFDLFKKSMTEEYLNRHCHE